MLRLSLESRARVEDGTAQKKKQKKKADFRERELKKSEKDKLTTKVNDCRRRG